MFVVVTFHEDEPIVEGPFDSANDAQDYVEALERRMPWANKGVSVDWFHVESPVGEEEMD